MSSIFRVEQSKMSRILIHKGILVVFAVVTMGIGLHSHYHSDWSGIDRDNLKTKKDGAPYHLCENWPKKSECGRRNVQTCRITGLPGCSGNISVNTCDRCPGISMERFFVAMIIICMLGSLASLGFTFLGGKNNGVVICGDAGLNVVLGVLLLISSILYIVSAAQVHTLFNHIDTLRKLLEAAGFELRELQGAKIAAAVLGIIQSIIHFVIAVITFCI